MTVKELIEKMIDKIRDILETILLAVCPVIMYLSLIGLITLSLVYTTDVHALIGVTKRGLILTHALLTVAPIIATGLLMLVYFLFALCSTDDYL